VFDHVTIRVSNRDASERFYRSVLETLGIAPSTVGEHFPEWDDFSLSQATAEKPVTRRLHIAFAAPSRAHVETFWRTGLAAGYRDAGAPGLRPQYSYDYFGAFLLDPDGNSAEAVHHRREPAGHVDHLWIRVADVEASRRFYETIAPHAGFRVKPSAVDRVQCAGDRASFSLVAGTPTQNVHVAFGVSDNAAVDVFHRAAMDAGYRDNGGPGERPVYHAGYYAAFVLDPDGNNVELVNHNR
jgi:catechol 2,3-dioxygenase-like lactoylglutathione lyase family enzyme